MKDTFCILCNDFLSSDNNSKEHLILNSIGGRKKIRGITCRSCNNQTGSEWDKVLSEQLRNFNLLFKITRERGNTPPKNFETVSGKKIQLCHDGTMRLPKPVVRKIQGEKPQIRIEARSFNEAKRILTGLKKKHPTLNIEESLKKIDDQFFYLDEPIKMGASIGGDEAAKSFVKSALMFAVENGIESKSCQNACYYLKNDNAKACWGFYYNEDIILNRPLDRVFHCVAISSNLESGLLLGYVEFFSAIRIVICLSDSYVGPNTHNIYAIDPVLGKEIKLNFQIPLISDDLITLYNHEKNNFDSMKRAFEFSISIAHKSHFERAADRAWRFAIDYAFKNCGAKEGEILNEDHIEKIRQLATEKMMPFLKNFLCRDHRNV